MRKTWLAFAAVTALGIAGTARAQGLSQTHDGFYLQMDLGFGSAKSDTSLGGNTAEVSGTSGVFSIALGGVVAPNFIIGGQLWGVAMSSPTFKVNGNTLQSFNDDAATLSAIGLNLTYYFMPVNIYIQATPSIGTLSTKQAGTTDNFKSGFAIRLAAGKEWWVSDNWGLGLNLQYAHGSNDTKDVNPTLTFATNWFGVAFSATYN